MPGRSYVKIQFQSKYEKRYSVNCFNRINYVLYMVNNSIVGHYFAAETLLMLLPDPWDMFRLQFRETTEQYTLHLGK